jgi:hypothetical protein
MVGHDVVVLGFRLNGAEPPAKALERVLRCSSDDARALSKRFPATVRARASVLDAEALATQLREVGARVEVRVSGAGCREPADLQGRGERADGSERMPIAPPEPVGPLPVVQAAPAAPAEPDMTFKVGTLRIQLPARARDSLAGKYLIGTLKILLPAGGPPPPPAAAPAPAAQPVETATSGAANLYETGVRDDVLDDPASATALELDTDALQRGGRYVSGGRAQRPSLMMRVRASLVDMPSNLVRRRRTAKRSGRPFRGLWRSSLVLPSLLGGLLVLVLHLLFGSPSEADRARVQLDAQQGTARGEAEQAQDQVAGAEAGEPGEESQPPLNPLLKLAPEPMEAPLAAIMRKRVPGVHTVAIEWPEGEEPKEPLSCMLVEGSTAQRDKRVHELLTTGQRVALTAVLETQLRDHAEVLRIAVGNANAHFTPLCLRN